MSKKPNPDVIRPIPDRCQMHGKTLYLPVKPDGHAHYIWICVVCVCEDYLNDDITGKIRKDWPEQLKLGPLALREHLKKETGGVKRKGATGV